ncbi:MAG: putative RNA methyltransferase [Desulfurivibrionaceae bacterium]|jgi:23S rRNA (guanine745-N1)-methyltransferase|nr:methyltransferase domain-containing protein [Pseudomonadota bacterium]MBU4412738.1 methyltransferase domain-containing protein [Pseudomonadota bacterium]MCG2824271.1 methyltransferase domain-containing protein [Desulfobulbaceae bacterium]MDP2756185.1 methyltransferase domain-containing protein [Desulfurivibrionaceae bacterium]
MTFILQCPVCRQPLLATPSGYQCAAKHSFDASRQGYVNLVLAHNKHSKEPGDDPEMVLSRRRFLDLGYYNQISDGINQAIATVLSESASAGDCSVLDAGCGEGFYLARLKEALAHGRDPHLPIEYHGVDVSKFAIRQATQRDRSMGWFVASINDLPFLDDSLDLVLNVFSPANTPEFARILKASGSLVFVSPGPKHLNGLREIIYPVTREHDAPAITEKAKGLFSPAAVQRITYPLELIGNQTIMDLLAMTPYYWNIDRETKGKVAALDRLQMDVDVEIRVFRKKSGDGAGELESGLEK